LQEFTGCQSPRDLKKGTSSSLRLSLYQLERVTDR
jgi:hypothetical protein